MVITMKDYNDIRKRYLAGESQRHIAKTLGISRNTVAKYCEGASVPWERKTPERDSTVLTEDVIAFIKFCLEEDEKEGLNINVSALTSFTQNLLIRIRHFLLLPNFI